MVALLCISSSLSAAIADDVRPNIVLILADDLGYNNLGSYGQTKIQTPELDRMAEEGLRFTYFYAGAPLCLPSRSCLMTGLHMGHTRVKKNGGGGYHLPLQEEDTTLSEVLKAAGYRTAMLGKWALGDKFLGNTRSDKNSDGSGAVYKHHWDYYLGEPNQSYNHSYYPNNIYRYDPHGIMGDATQAGRLTPVFLQDDPTTLEYDESYTTDVYMKEALAFIDASKNERFFLYLPIQTPHFHFEVPELEPYTLTKSWTTDAKRFASMITRMDRDVGRILDRLAAHGIAENTLVIFTSDNGGLPDFDSTFDNNGNLSGFKKSLSEGGLRVPTIAWWPGTIAGNRVSSEKLYFPDFMPTFAGLAGIRAPSPTDGISFVPTLLGETGQASHDYLFFLQGTNTNPDEQPYYIIRGDDETRTDAEIYAAAYKQNTVVPSFSPEITAINPRQIYDAGDDFPLPYVEFVPSDSGVSRFHAILPKGLTLEVESSRTPDFVESENSFLDYFGVVDRRSDHDIIRFTVNNAEMERLFARAKYSVYIAPQAVPENSAE
jgi:arylsulfatase A-like enzyme